MKLKHIIIISCSYLTNHLLQFSNCLNLEIIKQKAVKIFVKVAEYDQYVLFEYMNKSRVAK